MKKLSEVENEIKDLVSEKISLDKNPDKSFKQKEAGRKKLNKRIDELKHLKLYLQTNPTTESLTKHLSDLEARRARVKDESNFEK